MNERTFRGLIWGLALFGFLADQGTKYGMFRWLYPATQIGRRELVEGRREVVPGAFRFIAQFTTETPAADGLRAPLQAFNGPVLPRVNHGALFGLGQNYQVYANTLFGIVSVAAAFAIATW